MKGDVHLLGFVALVSWPPHKRQPPGFEEIETIAEKASDEHGWLIHLLNRRDLPRAVDDRRALLLRPIEA